MPLPEVVSCVFASVWNRFEIRLCVSADNTSASANGVHVCVRVRPSVCLSVYVYSAASERCQRLCEPFCALDGGKWTVVVHFHSRNSNPAGLLIPPTCAMGQSRVALSLPRKRWIMCCAAATWFNVLASGSQQHIYYLYYFNCLPLSLWSTPGRGCKYFLGLHCCIQWVLLFNLKKKPLGNKSLAMCWSWAVKIIVIIINRTMHEEKHSLNITWEQNKNETVYIWFPLWAELNSSL